MKKGKFKEWLIEEGYTEKTAINYSYAIVKISKHLFADTNKRVDVFSIKDLNTIENLVLAYSTEGIYSDFGHEGNGTVRNAIKKFMEYRESMLEHNDLIK